MGTRASGCPHGRGHDEAAAGLTPTEFVSRQEARPCRTLSRPADLMPRARTLTRSGTWSRPGGGSAGGSQVRRAAWKVSGRERPRTRRRDPRARPGNGVGPGRALPPPSQAPSRLPVPQARLVASPPKAARSRAVLGSPEGGSSAGTPLTAGCGLGSRVLSRAAWPQQPRLGPGLQVKRMPASRRPAEWRATEEEPPPGRGRPRGEEPPPVWKCERKLVTSFSWIHCPKKTSNVCQEASDSIAENSMEMYRYCVENIHLG
ncbi:uncharacterized protein LOC124963543 [Sciurus carolinensis]|uniref:uncharacterized protein LOC124963543 n=1 Tax=Sciurus carolinensis TaxID=30640 RepID=UPI001FB496D1|nr:uncharacterized protein LOC124963543 [Sciurus carolinensis]